MKYEVELYTDVGFGMRWESTYYGGSLWEALTRMASRSYHGGSKRRMTIERN